MKTPLRLLLLLITTVFLGGCMGGPKKLDYTPSPARFYLESNGESFSTATLPISGVRVAIGSKAYIGEADIIRVEQVKADLGTVFIFYLTAAAGRDLYRFTGNSQGRRLVLAINDRVIGVRMIDRPFSESMIATYVEVPEAEQAELLKNLNRTCEELQKELARKG